MWAFPGAPAQGGASGALIRMASAVPGGGGTLVHFGCDDCAVEASRNAAAGGGDDRRAGQHRCGECIDNH